MRNCNNLASATLKFWSKDILKFNMPGPWKERREAFPRVPKAAAVKEAGLK